MSNDRPRTRQELYDRIKASSKDEVILEDMVRLGFWPKASALPQDPAEDIRRKGELERELKALQTQQNLIANTAALRAQLHKQRLDESKRKRKETKERKERERKERAEAWKRTKEQTLVYLGEGVSGGLTRGDPGDASRVASLGLPALSSPGDIARALGLSLGQLRFLAFTRKVSKHSHYVRFRVPKKTGGERLISAPMARLKRAQRWALDALLAKVPVHDAAHGFCEGRSIVSNARPHIGAGVVLNLDLKDFFPTVGYRRVKRMFLSLGYGESVAIVLALLCTEPDVDEVELDGQRYYVEKGKRRLPQGAPSSPQITNIICNKLDERLSTAAAEYGFVYTRYADDLTFSAKPDAPATDAAGRSRVGALLYRIRRLVERQGFTVHPDKTRVLRRASRQEVTGVVVNDKLSVNRDELRRVRALIHHIEKDGPAGKHFRGKGADSPRALFAALHGYCSFVEMVTPDRGRPLKLKVQALAQKHGVALAMGGPRITRVTPPAHPATPAAAPQPTPPQAAPPPQPATPPEPPPEAPPDGSGGGKKWWKLF